MKKIILFWVVNLIAFSQMFAQTVILTEDFETDGEGSRYVSTTFDDCASLTSDYFLRTNINPYSCTNGSFGEILTNVQGSYFWVSEDIDGAVGNSGGSTATLDLNPLNVAGYSGITISLYLAVGRSGVQTQWETDDFIKIQVNLDGGGFTTIGQFVGDAAFGGYLRQDADLNGVSDGGGSFLTNDFAKYTFNVPTTGSTLTVRILLEGHDGSEEFAFDHIEVSGILSANSAPVLANIEGTIISFTEGDPAVQVSNTLTVSDSDDANLESATVSITSGFDASEDVLAFTPVGGIIGSYNATTGILSLSGTSTLANYQTVLRSVTYQNTDVTDPSTATRTIRFQVNDGTDGSNFQTREINIITTVNSPAALPVCESFETNGEGTRYTSNTFDFRPGSTDFFVRSTLPVTGHNTLVTGLDGTFVWASEDANSNGLPATLTLSPFIASGLNDFNIEVLLGVSNNESGLRFEDSDAILIQYNMDGGTWITVGAFYGDAPLGGQMRQDVDLNGVADPAGTALTSALTNFSFPFNGSGTNLNVRIVLDQTGGSEEIVFDNICVSGLPGQEAPVLANIMGTSIDFTEGDVAIQISNSVTITDADDTHMESASISICEGFVNGEDVLAFTPVGGITGVYTATTGVLQLSGSALISDYQNALRSVTYLNTNTVNPGNGSKKICFTINDGDVESNQQSMSINIIDLLDEVECLPFTESFETDGEGITYNSNTFNDDPDCNFFFRTNTQPTCHADAMSGVDGSFYWAAEDVEGGSNGPVDAFVELAPLVVTGFSSLQISVLLGVSNNSGGTRFETDDAISIQYSMDGGAWTTVGEFFGDGDGFSGGHMRQDADLNGQADPAGTFLTSTMQDFTFSIPVTGNNLKVRIRLDQLGGSEEITFDNIRITGDFSVTATCNPDFSVSLDGSGLAQITAAQVYNGDVTDCGIQSISVSPNSFTCADIGANTVTLSVTDLAGNITTCATVVTVNDISAPTITCPGNQQENISANCNFVMPDYTGLAVTSDNCTASPSIVQTPSVGTIISGAGTVQTVTLRSIDNSGNFSECTFDITLIDNTPPEIICPVDQDVYVDDNCEYIIPDYRDEISITDNCEIAQITQSPEPGFVMSTNNPSVSTSITIVAEDLSGNKSTCTFSLTAVDNTPPLFTSCPSNIEVDNDPGQCGAIVNYSLPTFEDNCGVIGLIGNGWNPGDLFPIGITTVNYIVADAAGNQSSLCSFTVTVNDVEAPVLECIGSYELALKEDGTVNLLEGISQQATFLINTFFTTFEDNCDVNQGLVNHTTDLIFDCTDLGTQNVTFYGFDINGNSTSCTVAFTITDPLSACCLPPEITCPADVTVECGLSTDPSNTGIATSVEGCGDVGISFSDTFVPGCGNTGTITRTWTATDEEGNTATCIQTITIIDTTPPVAPIAPGDMLVQCIEDVPVPLALTAVDNCDGHITVFHPDIQVTPALCANDFTEVRTWTFTDGCGNTSSVSQTITVKDDTAPVISGCPVSDINIPFTDAGQCYYTASGSEFDVTANDNCLGTANLSYSLSGATSGSGLTSLTGVQFNYGATTVVWTAVDDCGNSSTCSFVVIVNQIQTITTVSVNPGTQQYSDLVEFEATIVPWNCLNAQSGDVTFYVGTQAMGAAVSIGADGKATAAYPLAEIPTNPSNGQMSPGVKTVSALYNIPDPAFDVQNPTTSLIITQEDASVEYVGAEFQATNGSNSSAATIELRAVLQSIPDGAGLRGDIRNACVLFEIYNENGSLINTISGLVPELLNPADITTGAVVTEWATDIGNSDYESYDVKVIADCYFTGEDHTVVTVYKPVGDFITGGGHIKPTNSSGIYASTPELKTNFGFHVKFNKKGKNLQGGMNIIFRQMVGNEIQLFKIKTNAMSSLGINIANPDEQIAEFSSKANLKNLTTGEGYGGNLTLQVKIIDRGEPGDNDEIAITLWSKNTLLHSSNWSGLNTDLQYLVGGNTVVHAGFSLKEGEIITGIEESIDFVNVEMYPNPSKGEVILQINSSSIKDSEVIVRSITGSEVFRQEYKAAKQIKLDLSDHVSGIYLIMLNTGDNSVIKKLILDRK